MYMVVHLAVCYLRIGLPRSGMEARSGADTERIMGKKFSTASTQSRLAVN